MTIFRSMTVAMTVLALSACSTGGLLTSKEPPQTIYSLRPAAATGEQPPSSPARIVEISHPSLPPGMDRDRIALYTQDGQKLDYYASARWSSTLDEVLQNFTRRTAGTVLPYVIAVTPDQNIDANYRLQIKVNDFQPVYGTDLNAAPVLEVSIEFTLIALPTDTVVSSFTLSKRGTASSNRLDVVTAGLEKMLQEIEHDAFVKMDVIVR